MKRQCSRSNWNLSSTDRSAVIGEMLADVDFSEPVRELLSMALETREVAEPTIVHPGIAMPHCRSILVDDFVIVLARSMHGVPWPEEKVKVIILFVSPVKPSGSQEHMELIRHLAKHLRKDGADKLLAAETLTEAAAILRLHMCEEDV